VQLNFDDKGYTFAANNKLKLDITDDDTLVTVWDSTDEQTRNQITSRTEWAVGSEPTEVYVEGLAAGTSTLTLSLTNFASERPVPDLVRIAVVRADLDIDSDNDNALGRPDRSPEEEIMEDVAGDPDKPGKILFANTGNEDGDDVPNFADGFDLYGNAGDNGSSAFTPLLLELLPGTPLSGATVTFTYSASDPGRVTRTGNEHDGYEYSADDGHLRLWTRDAAIR